MAVRSLLHLNRLVPFRDWMEQQGWTEAPIKGEFEVLRLVKPKEKPIILYKKSGCDHAVVRDKDYTLVSRYIRENRNCMEDTP